MQGVRHVLHLLHVAHQTRDKARGEQAFLMHCGRLSTEIWEPGKIQHGEKGLHWIWELCLLILQVTLSRHVNSHFKNPPGTVASSPSGQRRQSAPSSPIKFYIRKNRRKTLRSSRDQAEASVPASGPDLFHVGIMAGIKDGLSRFSSAKKSSSSSTSLDLVLTNGGELVFKPGSIKSRKLDGDGNVQYLVSWSPGGM